MTGFDEMPGVPRTFRAAQRLLRCRPLGETGLAMRAMRAENAGGTSQDVDLSIRVAADLRVGAYLEVPTGYLGVTPRMLAAWRVSFEAVLKVALKNSTSGALRRATATPWGDADYVDSGPAIAAALLRPDLAPFLCGIPHPLVLVPSEEYLVLADADDPESVDQALRVFLEAVSVDGARFVSRTPLRLTPAGWEPVTLPETPLVRAARHLFDAGVYAEARDLIKATHDRLGVMDVIMPSYQVFRRPEGGTAARTSLTDTPGVRTFLPLADDVVLARDAGITVVPMAVLRAIEGLTTPVPGLLPPYLEVSRFPTGLVAGTPAPVACDIDVSHQGIVIDGTPLAEMTVAAFRASLGRPRVVPSAWTGASGQPPRTCLVWDAAGIAVWASDQAHVTTLQVRLAEDPEWEDETHSDIVLTRRPLCVFSGTFTVAGRPPIEAITDDRLRWSYRDHTIKTGQWTSAFDLTRRADEGRRMTFVERCEAAETGRLADLVRADPAPFRDVWVSYHPVKPSSGKWNHRPVAGPTLVFDTPEFAYAIIDHLMNDLEVLTPKFDLRDFAADQGADSFDPDDYESTIVPVVCEWFLSLPIPAELGARVEKLGLYGGTIIQLQLAPDWHGEDDLFDIPTLTARELAQFPNLKTIDDDGFLSPAARATAEAAGITVTG